MLAFIDGLIAPDLTVTFLEIAFFVFTLIFLISGFKMGIKLLKHLNDGFDVAIVAIGMGAIIICFIIDALLIFTDLFVLFYR